MRDVDRFTRSGCARLSAVRCRHGPSIDGDADREIIADERGTAIDGDQLMAINAGQCAWTLKQDTVVAAVASNLGLERCLRESGIHLLRTKRRPQCSTGDACRRI